MKKVFNLLVTSLFICLALSACGHSKFVGNETSDDKGITLDYSLLNTTKSYSLTLSQGASLDVVINNQSGNLHLLVNDSKGNKLYQGDNVTSGVFSLDIPASDTYTFIISGANAAGSVSFKLAK